MKVISLNTWSGVLLEPLLKFFESHNDVGIFCLQEIYSNAAGKEEKHPVHDFKLDIFQQIQHTLRETHVGYFRPAHQDYYGLAMFVRKEIQVEEEGGMFVYENNAPRRRGERSRNIQYISMTVEGISTMVIHIHGQWSTEGKADSEARLLQSKKVVDFLLKNNIRKILIGDFNLEPNTQSLNMIETHMRNLITENTITSTRTHHYKETGTFSDYAFVSPEIKVLDFKVLPDEVSDHSPLYLEFE